MSRYFLRGCSFLLALCAPLAFAADKGIGVDLTEAEVVQVLHVVNMAEMKAAQDAQSKATNPKVKEFAAMMIKDHTAMNEKVQKVAQKLSLTPAQSALSRGLEAKANAAITGLKATSGEVYDEGYIASQVSMHGDAQEAVRDSLMPSAKSEELKTLLQEAKTKIDAHLQQAQQLQEQL